MTSVNNYIFVLFLIGRIVYGQFNPNYWSNRTGIVHLFEWKFNDIADECERFLAPAGYGGVQTSPVNENRIVTGRPWWERYQPISYKFVTRSGNQQDLQQMINRCNKVGIRIYIDVIFNHMATSDNNNDVIIGTDGSKAYISRWFYPSVPYIRSDFHQACQINNWNDPYQLRDCQLVGLPDLNQSLEEVRKPIVTFLNELIDMGVAGFRVDAAKHMWPYDLKVIFERLNNLSTKFFTPGSRPFIIQEVNGEGFKDDYTPMGTVTEFDFTEKIGQAFHGLIELKYLKTWGESWGFIPSKMALVFVDNHDNERSPDTNILTFKEPIKFKMAMAFMLAHPYGVPRVMSSYNFQNFDQGPPTDPTNDNIIISPRISPTNGQCEGGWVCEHRWPQIAAMIKFRNIVKDQPFSDWWNNESNLIGFSRGQKGAIYFNNQNQNVKLQIQVKLSAGIYCDIFTGQRQGDKCTGLNVTIDDNGMGVLDLHKDNGVFAFHIGEKIKKLNAENSVHKIVYLINK